jgi:hypothetical protein
MALRVTMMRARLMALRVTIDGGVPHGAQGDGDESVAYAAQGD